MDLSQLRYAATHEWAHVEGDVVTVGITQFAVDELNDIVFLELPEVGTTTSAGQAFGEIESVKAVSELFAPVGGEIIERNDALADDPATLSEDAYDGGWMIKIRTTDLAPLGKLLTQAEYDAQCTSDDDH